jgi:threonine/homoserine/homoserine lactone efflux protein
MLDFQQLLIFMAAGVLLNLTPGPDVLFVVSHSLRGGVRQGMVAALGITAGCFFHVAVAALGLGGLMATSSAAFNLIKWAGAAYLVWIGLGLLRSASKPVDNRPPASGTVSIVDTKQNKALLLEVFLKAFLTNVLNPKVALFFLAFVPQFIPANAPDPAWTFVMLGCLFNFNGFLVCTAWAFGAHGLSKRTNFINRSLQNLDRLAGCMFIGFGLKLAVTNAPSP